jgi:hypothetical protein
MSQMQNFEHSHAKLLPFSALHKLLSQQFQQEKQQRKRKTAFFPCHPDFSERKKQQQQQHPTTNATRSSKRNNNIKHQPTLTHESGVHKMNIFLDLGHVCVMSCSQK